MNQNQEVDSKVIKKMKRNENKRKLAAPIILLVLTLNNEIQLSDRSLFITINH